MVIALDAARQRSRQAGDRSKLYAAALDESKQPRPWGKARVMSRVVSEFNKIAQRRADEMKRLGAAGNAVNNNKLNYAKFHKEWVATGIAVIVKGRVRTQVLANWQQGRTATPHQPVLVFATDGSGQKGQAGWVSLAMRTTTAAVPADTASFKDGDAGTEEAGRVVLNPRLP